MVCSWVPVNHVLFQCANVCLAFSYLASDNLNGLLFLRFSLGAGSVFFALWGGLIICALDTCLWNVAFSVLNFAHFIYLLIKIYRPVKLKPDHEIVFTELFKPMGVKRYQYKVLEGIGFVLELGSGEVYAQEDTTKVERISVIIKGSVQVSRQGTQLHVTEAYEFLDSPEWVAVSDVDDSPNVYGVTLTAMNNIVCMSWKVEEIRRKLKKDKVLKNIFDSIIGKDVTRKLFQTSNSIVSNMNQPMKHTGSFVYLNQYSATGSESIDEGHTVKFSEQVIMRTVLKKQNNSARQDATVEPTYILPSQLQKFETKSKSNLVTELSSSDSSIGDVTHHVPTALSGEDAPLTRTQEEETIL